MFDYAYDIQYNKFSISLKPEFVIAISYLIVAKTENKEKIDLSIRDPKYFEQEIKKNLIVQLTAPVRWTQTMNAMIGDGCSEVIEVGPGKVLQGLFRKVSRDLPLSSGTISE